MIPLIFYSHSDYSDVWEPLFSQTQEYMPEFKKYLFSDEKTTNLKNDWTLIKYDDSLSYQKRMSYCLNQVEEDIILFHHEDMFLYEAPDFMILEQLKQIVNKGEIDIIKLARASYNDKYPLVRNTSHPDIYQNPSDLQFAIQPSICNKEKLQLIYSKTYGDNIWTFEANSSLICEYFKIKTGMVWREGDNKRGMFHWDSSIYPYFATAVVKGKWNITDYGEMLQAVLTENNIDISTRGTT